MTTDSRPGATDPATTALGVEPGSSLHALLLAASAPGRPDELTQLSTVLAEYRAHVPHPRSSPMKSLIAKLVAAKLLAATAGGVAVGGIALAAATGTLPSGAQDLAHQTLGAPAATTPTTIAPSRDARPAGTGTVATEPTPAATPSPSMVGLCRAYQSGVATSQGKALSNPAFSALTAAAGADGVPAYCATVLATAPGGRPTTAPTHKPTAHPTGEPVTQETGKPTVPADRAPASHPTSERSSRPQAATTAHPMAASGTQHSTAEPGASRGR